MKKASLVVTAPYQKNRIFDINDVTFNRDDSMAIFHELKAGLARRGYDLQTQDAHSIASSDLVIYNDLPRQGQPAEFTEKSHLLMYESLLTRGRNWNRLRHEKFKTIFVWNDDWVDNKKYFKFNYCYRIPKKIEMTRKSEPKLCTIVASGYRSIHPLELYSERIKTAQWFERHHPEEFELYGRGWEKISFTGPPFVRLLNWVPKLRELSTPKLSSWRGPAANKAQIYGKFKFSICYENIERVTGYISEKIFDCFLNGVVPVYWGAPDIAEKIPKECYIDRQFFWDHQELYDFLKGMTEDRYVGYLDAAQNFLTSRQADPFRADIVAEHIASVVTGGQRLL